MESREVRKILRCKDISRRVLNLKIVDFVFLFISFIFYFLFWT